VNPECEPDLAEGGVPLGGSMTGTVRWFKSEQGHGRITGDDQYVYFVHFSAIQVDGYKSLRQGQRVSFVWNGSVADHGRKAVDNVRLISAKFPVA